MIDLAHQAGQKASQFVMAIDLVFFASAVCVLVGGVVSIIPFMLQLALFDFISASGLLCFGVLMIVVDAPFRIPNADAVSAFITSEVHFLTSFTTRGLWYMFLGTLVYGALMDNRTWPAAAVLLSLIVFFIGLVGFVVGYVKSVRLEKARCLVAAGGSSAHSLFQSYVIRSEEEGARGAPPTSAHTEDDMKADEFAKMCNQMASINFRQDELVFIMNALCDNGRKGISYEGLSKWICENNSKIESLSQWGYPSVYI